MKTKGRNWLQILVLAGAIVGMAGPLGAGPIDIYIDGPWLEFGFFEAGSEVVSGVGLVPSGGGNSVFLDDPAWTYVSAAPTTVTVSDAFLHGDAFSLYDFGILVGFTPAVLADSLGSGPDPTDPAFTSVDPLYSHAAFVLGAGAHSLTLVADDSPYGSGAAYFRVDTFEAVPEPSTMLLIGSGLIAVLWSKRRSS